VTTTSQPAIAASPGFPASPGVADVPCPDDPPAGRRRLARLGSLVLGALIGAVAGCVLGAGMRLFMRLVTDDPDFTWSGTLFIVALFGVFGVIQGLVGAARRLGLRRRWLTCWRLFGGFGMAVIMMGAGALMAPTVVAGSLARHRSDWPRLARTAGAIAAGLNVVAVAAMALGDTGVGLRTVSGLLLMTALYAVVVQAVAPTMRPQHDGWRLPARRMLAIGVALLACAGTLWGVAAVGIGG
jgi:MFS family permease